MRQASRLLNRFTGLCRNRHSKARQPTSGYDHVSPVLDQRGLFTGCWLSQLVSAGERLCRNHLAAEKHTRTPEASDTHGVVSRWTAPSSRSGPTGLREGSLAGPAPHEQTSSEDRLPDLLVRTSTHDATTSTAETTTTGSVPLAQGGRDSPAPAAPNPVSTIPSTPGRQALCPEQQHKGHGQAGPQHYSWCPRDGHREKKKR